MNMSRKEYLKVLGIEDLIIEIIEDFLKRVESRAWQEFAALYGVKISEEKWKIFYPNEFERGFSSFCPYPLSRIPKEYPYRIFLHYHPANRGPSGTDLEILSKRGIGWIIISTDKVYIGYRKKIIREIPLKEIIKKIRNSQVKEFLEDILGASWVVYDAEKGGRKAVYLPKDYKYDTLDKYLLFGKYLIT